MAKKSFVEALKAAAGEYKTHRNTAPVITPSLSQFERAARGAAELLELTFPIPSRRLTGERLSDKIAQIVEEDFHDHLHHERPKLVGNIDVHVYNDGAFNPKAPVIMAPDPKYNVFETEDCRYGKMVWAFQEMAQCFARMAQCYETRITLTNNFTTVKAGVPVLATSLYQEGLSYNGRPIHRDNWVYTQNGVLAPIPLDENKADRVVVTCTPIWPPNGTY